MCIRFTHPATGGSEMKRITQRSSQSGSTRLVAAEVALVAVIVVFLATVTACSSTSASVVVNGTVTQIASLNVPASLEGGSGSTSVNQRVLVAHSRASGTIGQPSGLAVDPCGDRFTEDDSANTMDLVQIGASRSSTPPSCAAGLPPQPPSYVIPTAPRNSSVPVIAGASEVGRTLSSSTGTWSGSAPISYSYQWARCTAACSTIKGATGHSYLLISADVGAKIAVTVTAINAAGSSTATSSEVGPVVPTASQVKAALSKVLNPSGKNATTQAIVKGGGYKLSFAAPSVGTLVIDWFAEAKGKEVLVASARVVFRQAGKATVKLKLTAKGRRLLNTGKKVKITIRAMFIVAGGSATSATRTTAPRS